MLSNKTDSSTVWIGKKEKEMKIRNGFGFVSNSSTSSFVAIGFEIDRNQTQSLIEKVYSKEVLDEAAKQFNELPNR